MKGRDALAFVWEKSPKYTAKIVDQDGLWKTVIGNLFEQFIHFFASDLHAEIDFTKETELLEQELFQQIIQDKSGKRSADQLVKVHLKNGEEKWILIHIEVQSTNEKDFSERMFQYFYRIYDQYSKKVVALAVHTSPHKSRYADDFQYKFFGTRLTYAYNCYKLIDYKTEELQTSDHIFSKVMLAAKYRNITRDNAEKRYTFKEHLIQELAANQRYSPLEIQTVIYFVDYLLKLPEDLTEKLYDTLLPILQEGKHMAHQLNGSWGPTMDAVFAKVREISELQGIEQGKESALETVTIEMLKTGAATDYISKVTGMSAEQIEELQKNI